VGHSTGKLGRGGEKNLVNILGKDRTQRKRGTSKKKNWARRGTFAFIDTPLKRTPREPPSKGKDHGPPVREKVTKRG